MVTKLFNIVKPHVAVFGEKDYQQLLVIKRMVKDLNMDIHIIGVPIVRESDGLAMSSRNVYLSPEERKSALCLKKSIDLAIEMVKKGESDASLIKRKVKELINSHPFTKIQYVSICDPETLEEVDQIKDRALIALAVFVGNARLIDNAILEKTKKGDEI